LKKEKKGNKKQEKNKTKVPKISKNYPQTPNTVRSTSSSRRVMDIFLKYACFFGLVFIECIKTEFRLEN